MNKEPNKPLEALRWLCVIPGGILAGFLVLFPLHWILYFTLVKGGMVQMPMEDMAPIERFISPIISSVFFVYAGALIAPKKQFVVSIALFAISVLARVGLITFVVMQGIDLDISPYGLSRILLSTLAGGLGVLLISLKTKKERS